MTRVELVQQSAIKITLIVLVIMTVIVLREQLITVITDVFNALLYAAYVIAGYIDKLLFGVQI